MQSAVPILNVFYLFCYAWRLIREGRALAVGSEDSPNAETLFSHVLLKAVRLLLRRGLEKGYSNVEDELRTVRGRVLLEPSSRKMLFQQGKVSCRFDELDHDTLSNRILKATLSRLFRTGNIDPGVHNEIRDLLGRFESVSLIQLDQSVFTRTRLHSNNGYYELSLKLCELIYKHLLPTEIAGRFKFSQLLDDETRMSAIFEEFVRVFYQLEAHDFHSVRREDIEWNAAELDDLHSRYLPKMQTDVTLRSSNRTIIADAKFYKSVFSSFRGAEKVRAGHLYQIFSYLSNFHQLHKEEPRPEGLLIYPSASEAILLDYQLGGFNVRVATVNLAKPWQEIEDRLRGLVSLALPG